MFIISMYSLYCSVPEASSVTGVISSNGNTMPCGTEGQRPPFTLTTAQPSSLSEDQGLFFTSTGNTTAESINNSRQRNNNNMCNSSHQNRGGDFSIMYEGTRPAHDITNSVLNNERLNQRIYASNNNGTPGNLVATRANFFTAMERQNLPNANKRQNNKFNGNVRRLQHRDPTQPSSEIPHRNFGYNSSVQHQIHNINQGNAATRQESHQPMVATCHQPMVATSHQPMVATSHLPPPPNASPASLRLQTSQLSVEMLPPSSESSPSSLEMLPTSSSELLPEPQVCPSSELLPSSDNSSLNDFLDNAGIDGTTSTPGNGEYYHI